MIPRRGLARRALQLQLLVLASAVALGLAVVAWLSTRSSSGARQTEQRALVLAGSVAASRSRIAAAAPGALARELARETRATPGAAFALANRYGVVVRSAGAQLPPLGLDPEVSATRVGRTWSGLVRLNDGAEVAVGAVALRSAGGEIIGSLVAGLPLTHSGAGGVRLVAAGLEALAAALAVGVTGSTLVSRWLRAQTFGLELDELTNLILEQEAMFHGIREAVVGLDEEGNIQFANAEACRLLHLPARFRGRPATVLVPRGRVRDILTGRVEGRDLVAVHDDRILVMNRRPVEVGERLLGHVVTLVDRTESEALLRELDGMLGLTEALRAQAHDFSNRLHTIVGLIELGATSEAARFAMDLTVSDAQLAERLSREIGHPMIVALLLAKSAVAAERGVELRLAPSTPLPCDLAAPSDLLTVVGNLVDNAIEATQGRDLAFVEVRISTTPDLLEIEVADSGPGVPLEEVSAIFIDGYTTKRDSTGARRGLGLALVSQLVRRRGGTVSVTRRSGAVFSVTLPLRQAEVEPPHDSPVVGGEPAVGARS